MFTLEVENKQGGKLKLSQNETQFQIISIEGLTPPKAKITTNAIANFDGERFKHSKIEMRNLVITLKINGDVESNRILLYDFFDNGQYCKIYYTNSSRKVYVEGYCENVESDLFSKNQTMQISILCADPFWKSINTELVDLSFSTGVFEFPFSIDTNGVAFTDFISKKETLVINKSDVPCGMTITLTTENVYSVYPAIFNVKTGEWLRILTYLNVGETLIINTNKGEKSVVKIVDGVEENVMKDFANGSKWLQLERGVNYFTLDTVNNSGASLKAVFSYNNMYKGV